MSDRDCNVCWETKKPVDFDFLPCTHSFCKECINKLVVKRCPLCRGMFETETQVLSQSAPARLEGSARIERIYLAIINGIPETSRARRRRSRRHPTERRQRRRVMDRNQYEVFSIEDILPPIETEQVEVSISKQTKRNRRDASQQLRLQCNIRARRRRD